jgi:hypothetical protein
MEANMTRYVLFFLFAALAALTGCGKHFDATSAPGFVVLKQQPGSDYDWRAVAPEGVAVAVRTVKLTDDVDEQGDVAFWARAVTLRMRDQEGYALLATKDVRSADGASGVELSFGHDEDGKPFAYRVRLWLVSKRLIVAEAGGAKEQMDRYAPSVDWMLANVKVL